jgi:predicted ester cyclase
MDASTTEVNDIHSHHKRLLQPLREALYNFTPETVQQQLTEIFSENAVVHLCYPFEDLTGATDLYEQALQPLHAAWPDLERRDTIVIAGTTEHGGHWVGCCGFYSGTFLNPWLDIPPTGHVVSMRFHEFYQFENDRVVQMQALWDIPEVMMQAKAWPLAPSLGREWQVPGPATQDGLQRNSDDKAQRQASYQHVIAMLDALKKHPSQGGPEVMEPKKYWHPKMNWYGPAGIGTGRGVAGFRHWHQIPFLNAMPDRGQYPEEVSYHFFGDGQYVGVTGWPNMAQTLTDDGWLGIAASGKKITLRSLDFWRLESGLIRENWVLVDLLSVYKQLGIDVFARLREFNKARNMGPIVLPPENYG